MAYGDNMSYLPAMSRLMGEVEQPTQAQGLSSPQFGGSPEQLMGMLQSPHVQDQLQKWGLHFDPSQMRQSPFLPNQFMQHHPLLGGMLNQGMANVAATPEAPAVSGAGSGMTRAMQGMMGGPEMLRQYQVRQMLAPFQAAGMQMPMQEFQRKQELLQLLTKMEQDRQNLAESGQDLRERELERNYQRGVQKNEMQQPRITQVPGGYVQNQLQIGEPGNPNLEWPGHPANIAPSPQTPTGMNFGNLIAPGQPDQWQSEFHATDPDILRKQAEAKQTAALEQQRLGAGTLSKERAGEVGDERKAGMAGAKVDALRAKGEKDRATGQATLKRAKGETPEQFAKYSAQFNKERDAWAARDQHIRELEAGGVSPEAAEQMRRANDDSFEQAKKTIDDARRAGSGTGASQPWQRPGPISPGASPSGAQAGGPGSQQNQNVAPANPYNPAPAKPAAPVNPY